MQWRHRAASDLAAARVRSDGVVRLRRRVALVSCALVVMMFGWACEQQGPTSPSALGTPGGVSLDAAGGVILGVKAPCVENDTRPQCKDKDGGGGGGKGSPPAAEFAGAMKTTTGQPFLLTFFKESDTNLGANSDSKSPVPVTKAFLATKAAGIGNGNCQLDPTNAPQGSDLFNELVKGPQETFATIINVDKTTGTGSVSLHYHETDSGLGLISLKVGASPDWTSPSFGSPQVIGYDEVGGKITYRISGGAVVVNLREGKVKDHVSLACDNLDFVDVTITK